MILWDEKKRMLNLEKHGLDFADAFMVFDSPEKLTMPSWRGGEERKLDIARVREAGMILALVYVTRGEDSRVISFRIASRRERRFYEKKYRELDELGTS